MYINLKKKFLDEIETTAEINIPPDPLDRVIGHDDVIWLAKVAARQKRNLLLVGPPGIGKSLIAQSLSFHLSTPSEEISTVHNPERPERPFIEVKTKKEISNEIKDKKRAEGEYISPEMVPDLVAERLGFKCIHCGDYNSAYQSICPQCGGDKFSHISARRKHLGDLLGMFEMNSGSENIPQERVTTTRIVNSREEVVIYERVNGKEIKVMDQQSLEKRRKIVEENPRHVIVPLKRKNFIQATGASETELLGDVRHDPYGGHCELGSAPYERVIPGAIHEAHEGVLFIDEIIHIASLQRYILSAMQEKIFPIVGRNPQSAGSSVKVESVPCDFIFVAACNLMDLKYILPPLRSRIQGEGYEVLMNTTMKATPENAEKIGQFIAQEINIDGKIPHATKEAVEILIKEAKKRAYLIDEEKDAFTLRLRDLGGVIRMAGDLAVMEESSVISKKHMSLAVIKSLSIEDQILKRYESYEKAIQRDLASSHVIPDHHAPFKNENVDRSYL